MVGLQDGGIECKAAQFTVAHNTLKEATLLIWWRMRLAG